jgi:hypothetical protein
MSKNHENTKDYAERVIDEAKQTFQYDTFFEKAVTRRVRSAAFSPKIIDPDTYINTIDAQAREALIARSLEKLQEGKEKYGDYSFQAAFENTATAPVMRHLHDEILDAINYAATAILLKPWKNYNIEDEDLETLVSFYFKLFKKGPKDEN